RETGVRQIKGVTERQATGVGEDAFVPSLTLPAQLAEGLTTAYSFCLGGGGASGRNRMSSAPVCGALVREMRLAVILSCVRNGEPSAASPAACLSSSTCFLLICTPNVCMWRLSSMTAGMRKALRSSC